MKKVFISIGVLIALVVIAGLIAPKKFEIEREVVINQPEDKVFNYLKQIRYQNEWTVWIKKDPNVKAQYRGADGTVGYVSSWDGNSEVGQGEQEIKKIVEGESVETELRFFRPFRATNRAVFKTEALDEAQTKVSWQMKGENPFPFNLICLVMGMQKQLIKDFDEGLANLKTILETKKD